MSAFFDELDEGEIHIRDKFQFELKSEYASLPNKEDNTYTMEFFFFIPAALQIGPTTYTKQQFYFDANSMIRLKTPQVSLRVLIESTGPESPLYRIEKLLEVKASPDENTVVDELKMYANIVRSAVRDRVKTILEQFHLPNASASFALLNQQTVALCEEIRNVRGTFLAFSVNMCKHFSNGTMTEYSHYIDEYISDTTQRYLVGLLHEMSRVHSPEFSEAEKQLGELIDWEAHHRVETREGYTEHTDRDTAMEYMVYRGGLLKKFVSEALFLNMSRKEPAKVFEQLGAAAAAGVAMFVYIYFLSYRGFSLVFDSTALILLAVLLYVVKDRLKEWLKGLSAKMASRLFPDYTTKIQTPNGETTLGYVKEFFSFLTPRQIPSNISDIRNTRFHSQLEMARRQENVFYYRKKVTLRSGVTDQGNRIYELNDIFRYSISRYLLKASDPFKEQLVYDPAGKELTLVKGPKVYHVNIIMRMTSFDQKLKQVVEYKKYRIVLDKDGIRRIEKVD